MDMPKDVAIPRNVIDVTYELNSVNYTDVINVTDSMFPTTKLGATTLVATDKLLDKDGVFNIRHYFCELL